MKGEVKSRNRKAKTAVVKGMNHKEYTLVKFPDNISVGSIVEFDPISGEISLGHETSFNKTQKSVFGFTRKLKEVLTHDPIESTSSSTSESTQVKDKHFATVTKVDPNPSSVNQNKKIIIMDKKIADIQEENRYLKSLQERFSRDIIKEQEEEIKLKSQQVADKDKYIEDLVYQIEQLQKYIAELESDKEDVETRTEDIIDHYQHECSFCGKIDYLDRMDIEKYF